LGTSSRTPSPSEKGASAVAAAVVNSTITTVTGTPQPRVTRVLGHNYRPQVTFTFTCRRSQVTRHKTRLPSASPHLPPAPSPPPSLCAVVTAGPVPAGPAQASVLLNVGPFGLRPCHLAHPFWSKPGCNKAANAMAQLHNSLLNGELTTLRQGLAGIPIVVVDTYQGL